MTAKGDDLGTAPRSTITYRRTVRCVDPTQMRGIGDVDSYDWMIFSAVDFIVTMLDN